MFHTDVQDYIREMWAVTEYKKISRIPQFWVDARNNDIEYPLLDAFKNITQADADYLLPLLFRNTTDKTLFFPNTLFS